MPVPIIGFQLYNLNDYDVKLFSSFEEDHLYFTHLTLVEHVEELDEGSSKNPEKLNFESPVNNKRIVTQFPFTGIYASEITIIDVQQPSTETEPESQSHSVTLFDDEYNYLVVLYLSSAENVQLLLSILNKLQINTIKATSYQTFIDSKIDQLDQKLFNETKGSKRLQRKINPIKKPFQIRNISEYVHFLDGEDPQLEQSYLSIIKFFDNVFLNAQNGSSFDATTFKRNI